MENRALYVKLAREIWDELKKQFLNEYQVEDITPERGQFVVDFFENAKSSETVYIYVCDAEPTIEVMPVKEVEKEAKSIGITIEEYEKIFMEKYGEKDEPINGLLFQLGEQGIKVLVSLDI